MNQTELMASETAPEPKRRKILQPPSRRVHLASANRDGDAASADSSKVPIIQTRETDFKILQAKNLAVVQAQQDGSKGNFRIVDSPYGNFLVPAIPTREELDQ